MSINKLFVSLNEKKVGELVLDTKTDELSFIYCESWVKNGFEISPSLAFDQKINAISIKRFLENLFPEGSALEELKEQFRVGPSNTFAVIKIIGKETAGALAFLVDEEGPKPETSFREVSSVELTKRLDERSRNGLAIWDGQMRLSVAGVQDKLPVTVLSDGRMGFGDGDIASTHILKFQKNDDKIPHLVLNEFFCMKLADAVGISVADVSYKRFGDNPALLVKRFDRKVESDTKVERIHIVDGCQVLNLLSSYRYERNFGSHKDVINIREGVSFEKLFNFSLKCRIPALEQMKLINWMLFNLLIGNSDAHGKNISFFVNEKGISVTPFYDLVNVRIYPNLDDELAMSIGDEFDPSQIHAYQFAEFCNDCGIQKRLLSNQLRGLCVKVASSLDDLNTPKINKEESKFWLKMKASIKIRLKHFNKLIEEISKVEL